MIGVLDTGRGGNLGSVLNACRFVGLEATRLTGPDGAEKCRALLLPGVGAFGDYMTRLRECGLETLLQDWIRADRPFLGICLGLQALFEGSEESPGVKGLGVFPGIVKRFSAGGVDQKVPQIGWNQVRWRPASAPISDGIPDGSFFYFVHSYFVAPEDPSVWAGATEYGTVYASALCRGRLMAVQFHPEKSQAPGLALLRNFGRWMGAPQ